MLTPSSRDMIPPAIIRASKLAAALFAAFFAYYLWAIVMAYATEPKVIGGLHLDQTLPRTTEWSPVWAPMILSALFAYATWPEQIPESSARRFVRGSFTLLRIELFAVFISALCPGLGGIYLLLPMLTMLEIPYVLGQLILSSAGWVAISLMFHGVAWVASSIVIGPAILFAAHFVSNCMPASSSSSNVIRSPRRLDADKRA